MKKISIILLILIPVFIFSQIQEDNRGFYSEKEHSFDVKSGDLLRVDTSSGDLIVDIGSSSKAVVKVVKRIHFNRLESRWIDDFTKKDAEEEFKSIEVEVTKEGNAVVIEDKVSWGGSELVNVDFIVTIPKNFNIEFWSSSGDIRINDDIIGNIDLKASSGDLSGRKVTGEIKFSLSSGDIKLSELDGKLDGNTSSGDIDIRVLNGDIYAHTSSGDIEIRELKAARGNISTSSGDVDITEMSGNISMKTSSGDVTIDKADGPVSVRCSSGDVKIDEVTGDLELNTSSGDVDVRGAGGSVDISTSSGYARVDLINAGAKRNRVSIRSRSGEISLGVPAGINADIDARIRLSSRDYYDRYEISSDFPIDISESRRYLTGKGKINNGGILITLETSNDNIFILKK